MTWNISNVVRASDWYQAIDANDGPSDPLSSEPVTEPVSQLTSGGWPSSDSGDQPLRLMEGEWSDWLTIEPSQPILIDQWANAGDPVEDTGQWEGRWRPDPIEPNKHWAIDQIDDPDQMMGQWPDDPSPRPGAQVNYWPTLPVPGDPLPITVQWLPTPYRPDVVGGSGPVLLIVELVDWLGEITVNWPVS